jgi:hypothetical protein
LKALEVKTVSNVEKELACNKRSTWSDEQLHVNESSSIVLTKEEFGTSQQRWTRPTAWRPSTTSGEQAKVADGANRRVSEVSQGAVAQRLRGSLGQKRY